MRFLALIMTLIFFATQFVRAGDDAFDQLSTGDRAHATGQWQNYFYGSPQGLYTPIGQLSQWQPYRWLKDFEQCHGPIESLWQTLGFYDQLFRRGRLVEADAQFGEARHLVSQGGGCKEALQTTYMVKSLLLGPLSARDSAPSDFSIANDTRMELALLVLFLREKAVVQALTEAKRLELAGDKKDSPWLEKTGDEYFITAFYSCFDTQIYIDENLRAFNMAASLYHELEHLYRDKLGHQIFAREAQENVWGAHIPRYDQDKVVQRLAFDEMSATIATGFYQRRMLIMEEDLTRSFYDHSGNEFNLYQVEGPLNRAVEYLLSDHVRSGGAGGSMHIPMQESTGFLFQLGGERPTPGQSFNSPMSLTVGLGLLANMGDSEAVRFFCDMHQIIVDGYFSETEGLEDCHVLSKMIWSPASSIGYLLAKFQQARRAWPNRRYEFIDVFDESIKFFDLIDGLIQQPSPFCREMIEAQQRGKLDHYIGTEIMPGGNGGNGGVRPILPCMRVHL
jgi:hypothetical protein